MKNLLRFLLIPALLIITGQQALANKEKEPAYKIVTA